MTSEQNVSIKTTSENMPKESTNGNTVWSLQEIVAHIICSKKFIYLEMYTYLWTARQNWSFYKVPEADIQYEVAAMKEIGHPQVKLEWTHHLYCLMCMCMYNIQK